MANFEADNVYGMEQKSDLTLHYFKIALELLSKRVLIYLTAIMGFGLFLYAMLYPNPWYKVLFAIAYSCLVFLPLLYRYGDA